MDNRKERREMAMAIESEEVGNGNVYLHENVTENRGELLSVLYSVRLQAADGRCVVINCHDEAHARNIFSMLRTAVDVT